MITHIESQVDNKDRIAIVIVGYNRLNSIKRVLSSVETAEFPDDYIPLILSIDCSGDQELYDYVQNYHWMHGQKYVNIHTKRLGLKKHIFECCSLSKYFKGVIILEDDSFVSPYFYDYAVSAIDKYGNVDEVCGISLYVSYNNEYVNLPFSPIQKGGDVFLLQDVQTRGECFTYNQWKPFEEWLSKNAERDYKELSMPEKIKTWTKAWSKYFYAYMIESQRYFTFPYQSYVTNMGAVGEHSSSTVDVVQVPLQWGKKQFVLPDVSELERYDSFYSNECVYRCLNYKPSELCIDYYGFNPNILNKRYILSCKPLPYSVIRTFGLHLFPIEMNIINNVEGDGLYLYDTQMKDKRPCRINRSYLTYSFCKQNPFLMTAYMRMWHINRIKKGVTEIFKRFRRK